VTLPLVIAMGTVLAVMNVCFYVAIDRLPLGTVAAIEFLPVILLAALGARSGRNAAALALAVGGVYLLTDVRLAAEPLGLLFAFANAALFALYIVVAHRVAGRGALGGIDGLAAAMLVALVVATPLGAWEAVPALVDPVVLLAGIGVGVTSSVIPYVCDQLALARMPRATYALLVSLLPATATAIGILVLGQVPSVAEAAGVALVVAGVAVHHEVQPTLVVPSENGARARPAALPLGHHALDRRPRSRRGGGVERDRGRGVLRVRRAERGSPRRGEAVGGLDETLLGSSPPVA
jgi:inner membrane transporter RhtA